MTTRIEIPKKEKGAAILLCSRLLHVGPGINFQTEFCSLRTHPQTYVFTIPHCAPETLTTLGVMDGIPADYFGFAPPETITISKTID